MKENRFKIINMIAGAFPKLTKERLPKDITGQELAAVWPELFNKEGWIVSKATIARRYSQNKQTTFQDEERATIATALYWSVISNANPYKIEIGTMLFWEPRQKEIFQAIDKIFTPLAGLLATLEKDRADLTTLGIY
jgi:hypothetical protein